MKLKEGGKINKQTKANMWCASETVDKIFYVSVCMHCPNDTEQFTELCYILRIRQKERKEKYREINAHVYLSRQLESRRALHDKIWHLRQDLGLINDKPLVSESGLGLNLKVNQVCPLMFEIIFQEI